MRASLKMPSERDISEGLPFDADFLTVPNLLALPIAPDIVPSGIAVTLTMLHTSLIHCEFFSSTEEALGIGRPYRNC
jgi:hypothetical protein